MSYRLPLTYRQYNKLWLNWNVELVNDRSCHEFLHQWTKQQFNATWVVDRERGAEVIASGIWGYLEFESEHDAVIFTLEGWLVHDYLADT